MSSRRKPTSPASPIRCRCPTRCGCAKSPTGVIRKLIDRGLPEGVLVNVNFPDCPAAAVKGVTIAKQGRREQELMKIDARFDGRGNPYYWIAFERPKFLPGAGTDLEAVANHRISITPLRLDLTDHAALTHLTETFA